jgi:ribosomal protein S24E
MKIKILNENDNKLFHRKEVSFNAKHNSESTPTKSTIYTYFSAKFKSPKTNMILKQFNTSFGAQSAKGMLYVYDNDKIISQVETKNTINRRNNVFKAEAAAANATKEAEEQTTEKPIEVKTSESEKIEENSTEGVSE